MRRLICLLLFMLLPVSTQVHAHERISSGLDAYEAADFLLASRLWEDDARVVQRSAATTYDKKVSGLAFVLSSMAAARAKHRRSYELWGEAQSLFAESGTRWVEHAAELRGEVARLVNANSAQVSFEEGAIVDLTASEQQLQRLSGTGILNYEKPPSGLVGDDPAQLSATPAPTDQNDDNRRVVVNRSPGFVPDFSADSTEDEDEPIASVTRSAVAGMSKVKPSSDSETPVLVFRRAGEPASIPRSESPERRLLSGNTRSQMTLGASDPVMSSRGGVPTGNELSPEELQWARTAWRYFEEAEQTVSGLADAHPGHSRVSTWDIGSHLAAVIGAHQLDVITDLGFSQRIELLLDALTDLPLYDDSLPNRNYTSDTAELLDLNGTATPLGSGWSAIDIGRLLIWMKILSTYYPVYAEQIDSCVAGWDLQRAVDGNTLVGAFGRREGVELFREGRFGFEHYAAQGFILWQAMTEGPDFANTRTLMVGDDKLSVDSRAGSAANGYALMLLQTELGCFAPQLCDSLKASLSVQANATKRRGQPVAVSDYHLDKAPWFATTSFAIDGEEWRSISVEGGRLPAAQMSLFTTKAAFLSDVLNNDSTTLMAAAADKMESPNGFFESQYVDGSINPTLSLSTNAAVIQALWYRQLGHSFIEGIAGTQSVGKRKTLLIQRF